MIYDFCLDAIAERKKKTTQCMPLILSIHHLMSVQDTGATKAACFTQTRC